jgi:hypothetical protein
VGWCVKWVRLLWGNPSGLLFSETAAHRQFWLRWDVVKTLKAAKAKKKKHLTLRVVKTLISWV